LVLGPDPLETGNKLFAASISLRMIQPPLPDRCEFSLFAT
jgi:hypothetical protein